MDNFERECKLEVSMKEKQVCSVLKSNMYRFIFATNLAVSLIFDVYLLSWVTDITVILKVFVCKIFVVWKDGNNTANYILIVCSFSYLE